MSEIQAIWSEKETFKCLVKEILFHCIFSQADTNFALFVNQKVLGLMQALDVTVRKDLKQWADLGVAESQQFSSEVLHKWSNDTDQDAGLEITCPDCSIFACFPRMGLDRDQLSYTSSTTFEIETLQNTARSEKQKALGSRSTRTAQTHQGRYGTSVHSRIWKNVEPISTGYSQHLWYIQ